MKNESEAEDSPDESHSTEFKMIREIPNLKGIFDKIIVTTKEANSSIMTVMNLVSVLSSSIQGKYLRKKSLIILFFFFNYLYILNYFRYE